MTDRIICIVGTYPRDEHWPLEMKPGVEFWAANEAVSLPFPGGVNRAFQMHPRDWREAERRFVNGGTLPERCDQNCFGRTAEHVEALRQCAPAEVYGLEAWDDIPNAVVYPFDLVRDTLNVPTSNGHLYATSTFGYMMALALTEHLIYKDGHDCERHHDLEEGRRRCRACKLGDPWSVAEIRLAQCELPLGTQRERVWEHPNLAFYLGMAHALGIRIVFPPNGSSLLNAPRYAIDGPFLVDDPDHWWSPSGSLELVQSERGTWDLRRR